MKSHTNNIMLQIFLIHSIFILLTFLTVFSVNVIVAEEVVPTISGVNIPVTALNSLMETAVDPPMKTALNSLMKKTAVDQPIKTAGDPPMELNLFNNNIYITNNGSNIVINNATNTSVGEVPFESGFNPSDNKKYLMNPADWNSVPDTRIDSVIDENSENIVGESVDTIIESAKDGDGEKLENGSSTTSDTITFKFSAEVNDGPREENVRFNCFLDNGIVSTCDSGMITYFDLEIREEPYIFKVNAFTPIGNDTTPANFNWTIKDDDDDGSSGGGGGGDDDDGPSGGGGGGDDDNGPSGGGGGGDDDNGPSGGGGGGDDDNGPSGGGGGGEDVINEADCPPFPLPNDTDCLPDSIPNGTNGTDEPPFPLPTGTNDIDGGPPFKPPSVTLSNKPWLILGTLS
jgi:hypothetical protein